MLLVSLDIAEKLHLRPIIDIIGRYGSVDLILEVRMTPVVCNRNAH